MDLPWMNGPWVREDSRTYGFNNGEFSAWNPRRQDDKNCRALLESIKTCGKQKDLPKGSRLHADILKKGLLEIDLFVSTALLRMYAKCGALTKAQEVFDELPARDVVAWNALISGYAQHGLGYEALNCFGQMQDEALFPDTVTFICILKACGSIGASERGEEIHAEIRKQGLLEKNIVLGTALVDMYAKCGALAKAQEVFDGLSVRNIVSWNALISGYAQQGLSDEALNCFGRMREEGLAPDAITFVCILKACASIGAVELGEEIHDEVSKQGLLENNVVLGTALVDMYAKCGVLTKAQEVFDHLPARDVALWNALVAGYAQHGLGDLALKCFGQMQDEGFSPDEVTYVCILKACGSIGTMEKGEEIHTEVRRQGVLERNIIVSTALVDMYAKCGAFAKAQEVLDELPGRNVTSWTALIAGYAQHGLGDEALNSFKQMREEGHCPNAITFVCVLKACGSIGAIEKGEEIHAEVSRKGLLGECVVLGNALVDMYAKCGVIAKAQEVFDKLPAHDTASWNSLITGYVEQGLGGQGFHCFERMLDEGLLPDAVTYVCILKACGSIGAADKGEEIHAEIGRHGLLEKHTVLGTALVDMYVKCGALAKAQEVLDELPARDVTSWTALMAGFVQHGLGDEALNCFEQMQDEGLSPNAITFVCILKACSSIGATEKGEEIHAELSRQGLLEKCIVLGSALVDMYAKCGVFDKAQEVFNELPTRDVISWTALIAAYAQLGNVRKVFESFSKMIGEHIKPNVVTFSVLLTACSHAGLVEEGQAYFESMGTSYYILPTSEHHICIVDLFSRAGHFDKALSMIEKVPPSDGLLLWLTLLGACRVWANVELGRWAFEHAVQLDVRYHGAYVCMSNIYAASGMHEDVD